MWAPGTFYNTFRLEFQVAGEGLVPTQQKFPGKHQLEWYCLGEVGAGKRVRPLELLQKRLFMGF